MNNGRAIFAFFLGAGVGSLITWRVVKDYYARIADEEIESVKEMYEQEIEELEQELEVDDEKNELVEENTTLKEQYAQTVTDLQYAAPDNEEKEEDNVMGPYLIDADELGEDYEVVSLTYYADGFLADDYDELIENVDEVVGTESLKHFGDNPEDPDTVYVRNDYEEIDYEICRSEERYMDVRAQRYTEE